MKDIESSSHEITKILHGIAEIAFQTNLLALNAAGAAAAAAAAEAVGGLESEVHAMRTAVQNLEALLHGGAPAATAYAVPGLHRAESHVIAHDPLASFTAPAPSGASCRSPHSEARPTAHHSIEHMG